MKILVDGNALAYRCMHAEEEICILVRDKRLYTGMTYGIVKTILELCGVYDGELIFFWDGGYKRKSDMYPEYKGDRKHKTKGDMTKDDIISSLKASRKLLRYAGVAQYMVIGEEADDSICSYAVQHPEEELLILTRDKDLLQLLRHDNVTVLWMDNQAFRVIDNASFIKDWGFKPQFLPHYLAVVGDKSDNIPGVKGIGDKVWKDICDTGMKPTIKMIYESLDGLPITDNKKKKIKEAEETVRMFLKLTKLKRDLDLEPMYPVEQDVEKLRRFLKLLNFVSILKDEESVDVLCSLAS